MRGEIPGDIKDFAFSSYNAEAAMVVYAFKKDTTTDYAIISEKDGLLKQYQRKSKSGQILMNVLFLLDAFFLAFRHVQNLTGRSRFWFLTGK